jgi:hypothetical protein
MRRPPKAGQNLDDRYVIKTYLYFLHVLSVCDARKEHDRIVQECREHRTPRRIKGLNGDMTVVGWKPPKHERPRCGAKTRAGGSCKAPAVPGKARCRMHGGLSCGPRTEDGKKRSLAAARIGWERWNNARLTAKAAVVSAHAT